MTERYVRVSPGWVLACGLLAFQLATVLHGQEEAAEAEEKARGWKGSAEVSAVMTSGNAEAESFGLRAQLGRKWQVSALTFETAGLRAESTTTRQFAVETPGGFRIVEESSKALTAESYMLRSRYDRSISERFFWFLGAGWDRNTFAGIDNRYVGSVGAGHHWIDSESAHLTTTYGVTYTRQEEVAGGSDSFAGVRVGYEYDRQLTATTRFGSALLADGNLDETSDYRLDLTNWIKVSMSDRLALKVSLQALYDNQPSPIRLVLFDEAGMDTGRTVTGSLDELDLLWTGALVISF